MRDDHGDTLQNRKLVDVVLPGHVVTHDRLELLTEHAFRQNEPVRQLRKDLDHLNHEGLVCGGLGRKERKHFGI